MGNIFCSCSEYVFANANPFVPQITEGRVVKVYDGDTITIVAKLPYKDSEYYMAVWCVSLAQTPPK